MTSPPAATALCIAVVVCGRWYLRRLPRSPRPDPWPDHLQHPPTTAVTTQPRMPLSQSQYSFRVIVLVVVVVAAVAVAYRPAGRRRRCWGRAPAPPPHRTDTAAAAATFNSRMLLLASSLQQQQQRNLALSPSLTHPLARPLEQRKVVLLPQPPDTTYHPPGSKPCSRQPPTLTRPCWW